MTATIHVPFHTFRTPEGKPTCSIGTATGQSCEFLTSKMFGTRFQCFFDPDGTLERDNGGTGYLMPCAKCRMPKPEAVGAGAHVPQKDPIKEEKCDKLAEAAGWKRYHEDLWVRPDVEDFSELECEPRPNYFEDLNACQALVRTLYKVQPSGFMQEYVDTLTELCSRRQFPHWHVCCALAEDVVEALGATLKLWNHHDLGSKQG